MSDDGGTDNGGVNASQPIVFEIAVERRIFVDADDAEASEAAGSITFVVTLSEESDETTTVSWELFDGTATRPSDYAYELVVGEPTQVEVSGYDVVQYTPVQVAIYVNNEYQIQDGEEIVGYIVTEWNDPVTGDPMTGSETYYTTTPESYWTVYEPILGPHMVTIPAGTYQSLNSADPAWPAGGYANGQFETQFTTSTFFIEGEPNPSWPSTYGNDNQPYYVCTPATQTVEVPAGGPTWENRSPISGTLVFAAGETSKTVVVYLFNDDLAEDDEAFELRIVGVDGGAARFGRRRHHY
ncbi:MAG: Calx-beta domain-containing protein [Pirellulales bacterium]